MSTARDYARFLEMVRNGGDLGGTRLLSPRTVALMTHNQSGLLHNGPALGFSLAFETTERVGGNGLDPVGAYGWGGAYGSVYRVDPTARARHDADDEPDSERHRHPDEVPDPGAPGGGAVGLGSWVLRLGLGLRS